MSAIAARLSVAALALLALAGPGRADPPAADIAGSWTIQGDDAVGRYRGAARFTQASAGRVEGRLELEYVRWSWSARRWVPTGRTGVALVRGRVDGRDLVGVRIVPAGLSGLGSAAVVDPIRYRVSRRAPAPATGSPLSSIAGRFGAGSERLSGHRLPAPAVDPAALRAAFRTEVEAAVAGVLHMSETDAPFTYRMWEGRAADGATLDAFKRLIGVPAARPGETRTLDGFVGWRVEHQPGESAEEAATVERYRRMVAALRAHLTDVTVYRIGDADASSSGGDILGGIHVFIVGRNAAGDLVGLETFVAET